jgi:hypothetical protein
MAATTRWVLMDISSEGSAGDGRGAYCKGTRGYSVGTASVGDDFTIGPTTNRLYISIDGEAATGSYITLYSGSSLDPRFVARDITEKLHAEDSSDERWANAICKWENAYSDASGCYGNKFKIYSGTLGSSSSVTVVSGTNSAHNVLGFTTTKETGGSATSNTFGGTASVSGTYYGLFSEVYKIVISNDYDETRGIATPSEGGSNSYAGSITTGGVFNGSVNDTYTIAIDVTNGTTMGAGTSNVPLMSWTSTQSDDSDTDTELLYPDYWYNVGTQGLMVKFTDAVFNTCDPAWTIACHKPDYAQGTNASSAIGVAQYVYSSDRGDMSSTPTTTTSGSYTRLGTRGLNIQFTATSGTTSLAAGDEFYVICSGPEPSSYNITSLNYGNVTVTTESDVKSVMFEIESGAAQMSTVKFGLQNHGSFSHHDAGNDDTFFRFGTVGPDNNGGASTTNGIEWYPNITADDIDGDVAPSYLYATKDNLPVVATADLSEDVGNYPMCGLTSDPIWLNIRLGASETGANSSINYRCYFDYS